MLVSSGDKTIQDRLSNEALSYDELSGVYDDWLYTRQDELEKEFYEKGIKYLIAGNVLKNHTYPLSVSAERVFQAIAIAEYAKEIGADAIAHGSTGAGNDQVRFDLVFNVCSRPSTIKVKHCTVNQDASTQKYNVMRIHGYSDTNMGTVAGMPKAS